jgi:ribosomal-protein-alanine N-acetyltransferase
MDLGDGIHLRPLLPGDGEELAAAYTRNREHLAPWEPSRSPEFFTVAYQTALVAQTMRAVADGRSASFVLADDDGRIVGRANLTDIVHGAFRSASLGYWLDRERTGHGIMRRAVADVCAQAQDSLGLHRVQAATLPHNAASQAVLRANGFTLIGRAARYLRIAGRWQDHLIFQRLLEDEVSSPARP